MRTDELLPFVSRFQLTEWNLRIKNTTPDFAGSDYLLLRTRCDLCVPTLLEERERT